MAKQSLPVFGSIYTGVRESDLGSFAPDIGIHNAKHWQINSPVSWQVAGEP